MITFTAEAELKLSKAAIQTEPSLSYSRVMALLRKKDVKVNGKRVAEDLALRPGDEVVLYVSETEPKKAEILYSDRNVLVAVKPKGIASVGDASFEERLRATAQSLKIRVAHRLDTNTEGLLLAAHTDEAYGALVAAFRAGEVEKRYVTIVKGNPPEKGVLRGYIVKDADASRVTVFDKPRGGAATAVTEYRAVKRYDGAAKLEVRLKTGKTHQIRAQLAHAGFPVLGDGKYGDYDFNRRYGAKSQTLRAYYLKLNIEEGLLSYLRGKTFSIDETFPVEKKLILL